MMTTPNPVPSFHTFWNVLGVLMKVYQNIYIYFFKVTVLVQMF